MESTDVNEPFVACLQMILNERVLYKRFVGSYRNCLQTNSVLKHSIRTNESFVVCIGKRLQTNSVFKHSIRTDEPFVVRTFANRLQTNFGNNIFYWPNFPIFNFTW